MLLHDKVALITGCGRGIGAAIVRRFAGAGADLVLVDVDEAALAGLGAEVRGLGRRVLCCPGDASREAVAAEATRAALAEFGRIDVLVNNVGIEGPTAPVTGVELSDWERVLAVNLGAPFLFCKHVLPSMRERRAGCVVNISSLSGTKGLLNRSPYCASKWAVIGLSRTVAEEVGPDGIRVNTICPGAVAGERMDGVLRRRAESHGLSLEAIRELTLRDTPLRRLVSAEEVAATALFLASDEASGITGAEFVVSGGRR